MEEEVVMVVERRTRPARAARGARGTETVAPSEWCATEDKISQPPAVRERRTFRARVPVSLRSVRARARAPHENRWSRSIDDCPRLLYEIQW